MPLALLLGKQISTLDKGVKQLNLWNDLVFLEELLIDRVRSAYVVRWFGVHLPVTALTLRIAIVNIDALRSRFNQVRAATQAPPTGPNLTAPLAGMAGSLAGVLLSPTGMILIGAAGLRFIRRSGSILWMALGAIGGFIVGLLTGGVGLAVGGLGVLFTPLGALIGATSESVRQVYLLLGALAELLGAVNLFFRQLLGPREGVRNPLVRQVLVLFDKLAMLVPFVIAFVAILVARAWPFLLRLANEYLLLFALAEAMGQVLVAIWEDMSRQITDLYTGPDSALARLERAFSPLTRLMVLVQSSFTRLFTRIKEAFVHWGERAAAEARRWWTDQALPALRTGTTEHPAIQALRRLGDALRMLRPVTGGAAPAPTPPAAAPPAAAPPGSSSPSFWRRVPVVGDALEYADHLGRQVDILTSPPGLPDWDAIQRRAGGAPGLGLGAITTLADFRGLLRSVLPGLLFDPFAMTPAEATAWQRARQPGSAFAGERRRLSDSQGRSPTEQLAALRAEDLRYRNLLFGVVENVLPQAAAQHAGDLRALFQQLDSQLYGVSEETPAAAQPFPVRQLPESNRLRLVVGRLRIQATGTTREAVEPWAQAVRRALAGQSYYATES